MTTKGPNKNKGKLVMRLLAVQMLILVLVVGICLVSAPAYAVSVALNGTRTVIGGSDCALATYRFGTNTTYSGQALDLLVEVIQEDNEQAGSFQCVGVDSGVLFVSLRDKDSGENIAYADLRLTLVAQGTTTPVTVDRMVVTGFDLDRNSDNTQTDTDDMYFTTGPTTRSYVSTNTQTTVTTTGTGSYNTRIRGRDDNCDDGATNSQPECRASVVFAETSTATVRVQNNNAYGNDPNTSTARRVSYLSFRINDFEDVVDGNLDYGDAPSSYGAGRQNVTTALGLGRGLLPDHDAANQPTTAATGDDNDGSGGSPTEYDDEDGVFLNGSTLSNASVFPGQQSELSITTFGSGYLNAWIDWNRDGDFNDSGERVITNRQVTNNGETASGNGSSSFITTTPVSVTVPQNASAGQTYARFKFTRNTNPGIGSNANDGEVEDYRLTVAQQSCNAEISGNLSLSGTASRDGVTNEITLTQASGNQAGSAWSQNRISLLAPFTVEFSIFLGDKDAAGADGIAFAFQRDPDGSNATGVFGGALGVGGLDPAVAVEFDTYNNGTGYGDIVNDHTVIYDPVNYTDSSGGGSLLSSVVDLGNIEDGEWHTVSLDWDPVTNQLQYRFDGSLVAVVNRDFTNLDFAGDPNVFFGWAASTGGSNNLQKVCVIDAPEQVLIDYGDAPASYQNPSHIIVDGIRLGADISEDVTGYDSATAGADSFDDGVTFPSNLPGVDPVQVEVTGAGGYLQAWIDWNRDGDFDDADEQIAENLQDEDGDGFIDFVVPPSAQSENANDVIARFRWSTTEDLNAYDGADDGEVEDYLINTREVVFCPQGSEATGGGIATGGTGGYRESVYWLDWNCGTKNNYLPGELVRKSWVFGPVEIRATVDNITSQLNIYNSGNWSGDRFDDLYQGVNPVGLANTNGAEPNFDIGWEVYLNGQRVPADIIAADVEDTDENESLTWETDGEPWEIFSIAPLSDLQARFENGARRLVLTTGLAPGTGTLLALTEDATQTSHIVDGSGVQAVGFGVFLQVDHGDIAGGYPQSGGHVSRRDATGGSKPTSDTDVNTLTVATLQPATPYLGEIGPDPEDADQNSANADADGPEEDGVSFPPLIPGAGATITVTLTEDVVGENYVQGWIDWNRDNDFDDASEQIALNVRDNDAQDANSSPGVIELNLFVPPGAFIGNTYSRFRLSSTPDVPAGGQVVFDGEVEDYLVTVSSGNTGGILSGWVYEDNGDGATAHDGIKAGNEPGIANQRVVLYHDADNNGVCEDTDTVLAETLTDGDGGWRLVPVLADVGKNACLVVQTANGFRSISENPGDGGASINTGAADDDVMLLQVQPSGVDWDNILFGDAGLPVLEPDRQGVVDAGNSLLYSHRFTARTAGSVDFSLGTAQTVPASPAWTDTLFRDADCDGELSAADEALPVSGVAVQAGDSLCLLVKVFAPADAPLEALHSRPLIASQTFAGTALQSTVQVLDTTRLTAGKLILDKTVRNIGPDGLAGTADDVDSQDGTANQASPGDVLRYRLTFSNQGVRPLTEVTINDSTPAFSSLSQAAVCPTPLPADLGGCNLTTPNGPNTAGYEGALQWLFSGQLLPGNQGAVVYDVRVSP
ncbi:hypothetical protein D4A39_05395 [Alcanivorax profundi]|uniref:Uncharacterized protein n=1 Tax=Alcanivorax profundi TaxID=2338368 RepID=A0A418XY15_9GAMM|nr:CshA/CshB family fibrillar adhesin-related protein [Alcanivorax profundi]RJG17928.1 hypothetical protein D4A39_05395 [Alcanivorax profundi]